MTAHAARPETSARDAPAARFEGSLPEIGAGPLVVRLAKNPHEIDAAQALRYRVFYDEMGARPDAAARSSGRDADRFDALAEHLLVVDRSVEDGPQGVVGTYRLLTGDSLGPVGRFYSEDEFDLAGLREAGGRLLEVGRSCIAPEYRRRAAMQLLWRGITAYIRIRRIDILFGCASLPGADVERHRARLAWLRHHYSAPADLRVRALEARYVGMAGDIDARSLDGRECLIGLPPLIKGYLRLGAYVGDGAVVDHDFNTTDVAIIVKCDRIGDRYYRHYERGPRGSSA